MRFLYVLLLVLALVVLLIAAFWPLRLRDTPGRVDLTPLGLALLDTYFLVRELDRA